MFSGTITAVSTGLLTSVDIDSTIASLPLWSNKLDGYAYYRGTAVLKVVLNAQPFQAGRVILHFLPNTSYRGAAFVNLHNANFTQITQQHSVELDFRETSAVLKAPYRGPQMWAGRNFYSSDWGTFYLTVLSPLQTGTGSTSVDYSVYLSFEDFEVAGPIIGEMGDVVAKKKSLVVKERKNLASHSGRISGTLEKLKAPLEYFRFIPGSDFVISGAQSALSGFAGILDVFGWSRPINPNVSSVMKFHNNYKGTNFNGSNDSDVLALDAMSQIMPLQGASSLDEMSFSYLKRIPAYVEKFTITSTSPGTILYSKILRLENLVSSYNKTVSTKTYTYYTAPPFVWLSRYFAYYRGSIHITLKFVKTCFHTGRIMISYSPIGSTAASVYNTSYILREVIDIREHNEITLRLPWLRPEAYLSTRGSNVTNMNMGRLEILTVNGLDNPATVANNIECLVYYSAGEDFELAKPIATDSVVIAEIGDEECTRSMEVGVIGSYPVQEPSLAFVQSCIGETFVSLKQLLSCARPLRMITPWNSLFAGYYNINLWPWGTGYPVPNGLADQVFTNPPLGGDYLTDFASGFAFYRGSIRLVAPQHTSTYGAMFCFLIRRWYSALTETAKALNFTAIPASFTGGAGTTTVANPNSRCMQLPLSVKTTLGGMYDVLVPFSNSMPFAITKVTTPNDPGVSIDNFSLGPVDTTLQISISSSALTDVNFMMRAGGDDFELFGFFGFLPFTCY